MANYFFGSGAIQVGGTTVGTLQDVSLDIAATMKELRGGYKWPVAIANGPTKVSGKAKCAEIQGGVLAALWGATDSGSAVTLTNALMGSETTFAVQWDGTFRGFVGQFTLGSCISPKFTMAMKNEDFTIMDFDFEAFAAPLAAVLTFSYTNAP